MSMFREASKSQARARVALIGPSGSGKTFTALRIAQGLGSRIAVLDTERGSASKYACPSTRDPREGEFRFQVVDSLPDFSPANYVKIIKAAGEEGFDVLIIDSLSHAWMGEGGALEMVDNAKARHQGSNFNAWSEVTPEHMRMIQAMLTSPCHVIATMRAKTEYVVEKDDRGKTSIRKLGLAPVQRDTMEYEFDVTAMLDQDHKFVVTKTRCFPLDRAVISCAGEDVAGILKDWLADGAPAQEQPTPQFSPATQPATPPPPSPPVKDEITERILKLQDDLAKEHNLAKSELVEITSALRASASGGRAQKLRELTETEADEVADGLLQWARDQAATMPPAESARREDQ